MSLFSLPTHITRPDKRVLKFDPYIIKRIRILSSECELKGIFAELDHYFFFLFSNCFLCVPFFPSAINKTLYFILPSLKRNGGDADFPNVNNATLWQNPKIIQSKENLR